MATEQSETNINELSSTDLKDELCKLDKGINGSTAVLRDRLSQALGREETSKTGMNSEKRDDAPAPIDGGTDGKRNKRNKEANEDSMTDEEKGSEDSGSEENEKELIKKITRKVSRLQPLTFKDVEDSLQTFSGDGSQNVQSWLEEFEETSEVCLWSDAQKIVYAKKLLRGSGKLFVTYEKCSTSWKQLKQSLTKEFAKTVNSRLVYRELVRTKKRSDESCHEYVYHMLEIASQSFSFNISKFQKSKLQFQKFNILLKEYLMSL